MEEEIAIEEGKNYPPFAPPFVVGGKGEGWGFGKGAGRGVRKPRHSRSKDWGQASGSEKRIELLVYKLYDIMEEEIAIEEGKSYPPFVELIIVHAWLRQNNWFYLYNIRTPDFVKNGSNENEEEKAIKMGW